MEVNKVEKKDTKQTNRQIENQINNKKYRETNIKRDTNRKMRRIDTYKVENVEEEGKEDVIEQEQAYEQKQEQKKMIMMKKKKKEEINNCNKEDYNTKKFNSHEGRKRL